MEKETDENLNIERLYSIVYDSYAIWNGNAWEDKNVPGAYFYGLEKAKNNTYYPEVKLTDEHLLYMSDEMYTPIHYKGMVVKQPFFEGKGNHSVAQLEAICEQYKEYAHQQSVIKHNCMKYVVQLKFGINLSNQKINEK
jgi:hypothetical protein